MRRAPIRPGWAVAAALLCAALPAYAQTDPAAEQISVTAQGRRDPTATTILSAAAIAANGTATLGALLDQLPSFGSQGVNGARNDGGFGEYFVDLRNLDFDRTLVLVDGKRFVPSGIRTDEAVDLNDIPAAFVDHIEVLRDGSQPQYAADAVAGVVNVVLKDHVDGLHLDAYGGAAGAGDAGTAEISAIAGRAIPGGRVALGLDLFNRTPILQADRAWAADPIAFADAAGIVHGSTATPGGHAVAPGPDALAPAPEALAPAIDALALGGAASRPFDPATDDSNDAGASYLQGGLRRATLYADADEALSDAISGNIELLYTDRSATTLQPPQTLGLSGTALHPDGFTIPATDPFNPFGHTVTLERVVSEAGPQRTTTAGPVWRVLAGLNGSHGGWDWSLSLDHGHSASRYTTTNAIDLTRALATAGNGACPAADGCVQADWFGPNSLSPAALAYIASTVSARSAYDETVGQAQLAVTPLRLPAGDVRLTLGAELRHESGSTTVDALTARGDQAGPDAAPTAGGYDTAEATLAAQMPLLRDTPAARRLDLSLAGRATATSRYGRYLTGKAVLDYQPAAGITLRAVAGRAQRPPAISEAFGGIAAAPQPVTDPCDAAAGQRANPVVAANCTAQGLGSRFRQASPLVDVLSGGNPALRPERADNLELGLTLAPPSWPFSASVDYYRYRIADAIDSLEDTDPNLVPDACYRSADLSSPLCRLITRLVGGGNAGQIGSILGLDENVGTLRTDGIEFGLTTHPLPTRLGSLTLDAQLNWLLNYRLRTLGRTGETQYAGTFPGLSAVGSYARLRARTTATLAQGGWSEGWTGRFIAGARVLGDAGAPFDAAPSVLYQDIQLSRSFGRQVAMLGIDNLADRRPPTLVDGQTNTDTNTYDVVGRFFWARVTCAF